MPFKKGISEKIPVNISLDAYLPPALPGTIEI
jgi:hypothetical protein